MEIEPGAALPTPYVEEVFNRSGVPTYTFVKPIEYQNLYVSLRTAGRGLVLEGPSGIGKTTSVSKALDELGLSSEVTQLTARSSDDREFIPSLPELGSLGTVIIDDFHRLDDETKQIVADYMKILADEGDKASKIVIVGINKAGESLVQFARDLRNRLDVVKFEANPEERVRGLVELGEEALNISIPFRDEVAQDAQGSFHIAQMLSYEACLTANVTERQEDHASLDISFEAVRERVIQELSSSFSEVARRFARGPKLRREGRAPYLHMLYWLAKGNEWSLQLEQAMTQNPKQKGSVGQVVDKGYLSSFINESEEFSECLHYDPTTRVLSVEDPKFVYYVRNLIWSKFAKQVGFVNIEFKSLYDFALSFSGTNRDLAEAIAEHLKAAEVEVFYDRDEQHRILAENVEEYLGPIYRSEAQYVVALLSRDFPKRIWTKFESDQFKSRFGDKSVIPVWFADAPPGIFDESARYGGVTYDPSKDMAPQAEEIAEALVNKLRVAYLEESPAETAEDSLF